MTTAIAEAKPLTKRDAIKRKKALAHNIRNLQVDYAGVFKEDIPEDVQTDLKTMMKELMSLREMLGNE